MAHLLATGYPEIPLLDRTSADPLLQAPPRLEAVAAAEQGRTALSVQATLLQRMRAEMEMGGHRARANPSSGCSRRALETLQP